MAESLSWRNTAPSSIEATTLPPGELMNTTPRSPLESAAPAREFDEFLRRILLDHAIGDDDLRAPAPASGIAQLAER